jgi:hypothetical protein
MAVAFRSNRIPILSPLSPSRDHISGHAFWLSFSEIFDMSELVAHYDIPVIDGFELKVPASENGFAARTRHRSVIYDGEHVRPDLAVGDPIPAEAPAVDELECWNMFMVAWTTGTSIMSTVGPAREFSFSARLTYQGSRRLPSRKLRMMTLVNTLHFL